MIWQRIVYEWKALPESARALIVGIAAYAGQAIISISRATDWHVALSAFLTAVAFFVGTWLFGVATGTPPKPPAP